MVLVLGRRDKRKEEEKPKRKALEHVFVSKKKHETRIKSFCFRNTKQEDNKKRRQLFVSRKRRNTK